MNAVAATTGRVVGNARAPLAAAAGLLLVWVPAAALSQGRHLVPFPWTLLQQLAGDWGLLTTNAAETLTTAAQGLVVGIGAVVPLAVVCLLLPVAEPVIVRIAVVVHVIPTIAIAPVLIVALSSETGRVVITALQVYFPALVGLLLGLRSTDERVLDVVTASGGGNWARMRHVRLASAVPSFVAALQIAVPAAVLGALISEFFGAQRGLGAILVNAQQSLLTARTWGIALFIGVVAALGYGAVTLLARLVVPWARESAGVSTTVAGSEARRLRPAEAVLAAVLSAALLLGGWQSLRSVLGLDAFFTKTPGDVLAFLTAGNPVTGAPAGVFWREFAAGLGQTALDAGVGFVVGTLVAVLAAVVMVAVPSVGRSFMPLAIVLRSVPLAALTPLLVLVFGRGLVGVTVAVTLVTFFPTLVTVMTGLRSTPAGALDVVRASGGRAAAAARHVRLLYAVPSITAAARVAIPGALAGATLAEWLATGKGLGQMLTLAYTRADYLTLWSGGVLLALFALVLYSLVGLVDRLVTRRLGVTA